MPNLFSRTDLQNRISATFSDPSAIQQALGDVTLPTNVQTWLSRLKLLAGVPINYLVPDEGMLPPESIRFFYLNMNWVDALIDGAFSLGRNLTSSSSAAKMNVDRAVSPAVHKQSAAGMARIRAAAFGAAPPIIKLEIVSGFLLRSSVVISCPGIGVYTYDSANNPQTLLRFERLGPTSDTLICLVDGDIAQADIHEPPEGLHYGIDSYSVTNGTIQATKEIHTFSTDESGKVKLNPVAESEHVGSYFRTVAPRTLRMGALGTFIAGLSQLSQLDAAQMGFEMTQGVGMVSFVKKTTQV